MRFGEFTWSLNASARQYFRATTRHAGHCFFPSLTWKAIRQNETMLGTKIGSLGLLSRRNSVRTTQKGDYYLQDTYDFSTYSAVLRRPKRDRPDCRPRLHDEEL